MSGGGTKEGILNTLSHVGVARALSQCLQEYGVDARLAGPGSPGKQTDDVPNGVIVISQGPIRRIDLYERTDIWGQNQETGHESTRTDYPTRYIVPDVRLTPGFPQDFVIRTVHRKRVPFFGKVVDIRWQGNDCGLGIIDRLNEDSSLKLPIIRDRDVSIEANPRRQCWNHGPHSKLYPDFYPVCSCLDKPVPSRDLWNCYQTIAHHLLETPVPTGK